MEETEKYEERAVLLGMWLYQYTLLIYCFYKKNLKEWNEQL